MSFMQEWLNACNYRITEGSEYQWSCFPNGYSLDSWNGDHDGHSFTITFSREDQTVYELQAHDYARDRAYRWINPDFKAAHDQEAQERGVNANEAWEGVNYVDLELTEDFFAKMSAIYMGIDYDTRVSVPLELDDAELFQLMKMAHERDITLNQMVEDLLRLAIDQAKS